jgi:hypothetical protein
LLAAHGNALKYSRDPALTVRLGRSIHVTAYSIHGRALLSAPTRRALIDLTAKCHRLVPATADMSSHEVRAINISIRNGQ